MDLNGFPGPYSAYVFRKINCNGILRLMHGARNRNAVFISAVGFCDKNTVKVFKGECMGKISEESRGEQKFGYDPIFIPDTEKKTFAEDEEMKARVSHRKKSFERFCKWYTSR
jgi:XTP/dITP diphosphohydrolase